MELGLALTLCALGSAFLIPAFLLALVSGRKKRRCTAPARAVVVDIKGRSSSQGLVFYPVYRYEVEGRAYQGKGAGKSPLRLKKGEEITIFYDPRRPQHSYIQGHDDRVYFLLALCFGVMGAIPILICLGIALLK